MIIQKELYFCLILFFCLSIAFAEDSNNYIIIFENNNDLSNQLQSSVDKTFQDKKNAILDQLNKKTLFEELHEMQAADLDLLITGKVLNKTKNISEINNVFEGVFVEIDSKTKIEEIKNLNFVKGVYRDVMLEQQLSTETHTLMNSTQLWSQNVSGSNLTGDGISIGILDGGLDLPHPDFNYCANIDGTQIIVPGNTLNVSYGTPHPFPNNYNNQTIINLSSFNVNNFTIQFEKIVIDSSDTLELYDKNNVLLQSFSDIDLVNYNYFVNSDYILLNFIANNYNFDRDYGYQINSLVLNSSTPYSTNDPRCSRFIDHYDFINNDDSVEDDNGHGTHVAGIAASNNSNFEYRGMAPNSNLAIYKVCEGGNCPLSAVLQALDRSLDPNQDNNIDDKLDIVSLSLGFINDSPYFPLSLAIDSLAEQGVVPVIAAGNSALFSQFHSIMGPGTSRSAITVGASYKKNEFYQYTNYGEVDDVATFSSRGITTIGTIKPDIIAPGVNICSSRTFDQSYYGFPVCGTEDHVEISGTSMATPLVSGVIALIKQKNPSWNLKEIKASLKATSKITDEDYFTQGWGRIQPLEVLTLENPACIVEYNTSYLEEYSYNFSTSNDITFDINATIKCNSFEYFELRFIPISTFDDTSQYFVVENQTLIFNSTQNGSIELKIPRNKFKKGILKLSAFDTNSTYNNYDLFYVENTFDDFAVENLSLQGNMNSSNFIIGSSYNLSFFVQNKNINTLFVDVESNYYYNPINITSNGEIIGFTGNKTQLVSETINQNANFYQFNNITISVPGKYCFEAKISSIGDNFTENNFIYECIDVIQENNTYSSIPLDFKIEQLSLSGFFNGTHYLNSSNYTFLFQVVNQTSNISAITVESNYYYNPINITSNGEIIGFFGNKTLLISETINQANKSYNFSGLNLQQEGNNCFEAKITTIDANTTNNFLYQCIPISLNPSIWNSSLNATLASNINSTINTSHFNLGTEPLSNYSSLSITQKNISINTNIVNIGDLNISTFIQFYFTYHNLTSVSRSYGLHSHKYTLNLSQNQLLYYGDISLSFNSTHFNISNLSITKENIDYYDSFDMVFNSTYLKISIETPEIIHVTFDEILFYNSTLIPNLLSNSTSSFNQDFNFNSFGLYSIYIIEKGETYSNSLNSFNKSKGNFSLIDAYYICYTNKTFEDKNSNEVDDSCESDLDQDEINDEIELQTPGNLVGGDTLLDRYDSSLYVNGSIITTSNQSFLSTLPIQVVDKNTNDTIIDFLFNFSNSSLDLSKLEIEKNISSSKSYLIIRELSLKNSTKNLNLKRNLNSQRVCIKDSEINTLSEISSTCNGDNETLITCNGDLNQGYRCTINNSYLFISGLKNSAVIEYNDPSPPNSNDGGGGSSGSGGGGSSSSSRVYIPSVIPEDEISVDNLSDFTIPSIFENTSYDEKLSENTSSSNNIDILTQFNENETLDIENEITSQKKISIKKVFPILVMFVIIIIIISIIVLVKTKPPLPLSQHEKELLKYLITMRKTGHSQALLEKQCIQVGWKQEIITKLFKIVNKKYRFKK